ncbi:MULTISPECIES: hypothetical protein [Mucilaginibacter]|jgi:hypothetical protein|uniref:hypothetical protein n=1 Tax=Mucilaginibacter TaxID=423349 RepID=UPI00166F56E6|nr:hypothetical protein [Mucilaginibacter rubeus]GGB27627.1 hypothetical protein GCM10011500_49860 [Mucilaginibacter rubeus]
MKQIIISLAFFLSSALSIKAQSKLNIYGGKNHDQFLGCVTCTNDDPNSIWNTLGRYGSTHETNSIWNPNGVYGSTKSDYSPFNKKAKCPPIILDENGKSKGYMTVNRKNPKRSWEPFVNAVSEERQQIVKDIPKYYNDNFHDFRN